MNILTNVELENLINILCGCLSLQGKLKNHIQNPTAVDLVHFLFNPLRLVRVLMVCVCVCSSVVKSTDFDSKLVQKLKKCESLSTVEWNCKHL